MKTSYEARITVASAAAAGRPLARRWAVEAEVWPERRTDLRRTVQRAGAGTTPDQVISHAICDALALVRTGKPAPKAGT